MQLKVVLRSLVDYAIVVLAGIAGGIAGAVVGSLLMPDIPSGGDFAALGDAILSLLLWPGLGFVVGYLLAAFASDRVITRVSRKNQHHT